MIKNPDIARSRVRLFCFPYAGGSSAIYTPWRRSLLPGIQSQPVQFPGRGTRFAEAPVSRVEALVEALASTLRPELSRPFAFFGHSMGALVSFELARYLRNQYSVSPLHLFVSGCSAPQVFQLEPKLHALPETEFINELRRLNGTPSQVFDNPELLGLLLPGLRADFAVCETYSYKRGEPLDCSITAFAGEQDREVRTEDVEAWRQQTTGEFSLHTFPGGHFFLHDNWELVVRSVNISLSAFC